MLSTKQVRNGTPQIEAARQRFAYAKARYSGACLAVLEQWPNATILVEEALEEMRKAEEELQAARSAEAPG